MQAPGRGRAGNRHEGNKCAPSANKHQGGHHHGLHTCGNVTKTAMNSKKYGNAAKPKIAQCRNLAMPKNAYFLGHIKKNITKGSRKLPLFGGAEFCVCFGGAEFFVWAVPIFFWRCRKSAWGPCLPGGAASSPSVADVQWDPQDNLPSVLEHGMWKANELSQPPKKLQSQQLSR